MTQTAPNPPEGILQAATEEFAAHGYAGARVEAIAQRAGVNKATLYYQIGNKDDLYAAVLLRLIGSTADDAATAVAAPGDPVARVRAFIGAIARDPGRLSHLAPVMMREVAGGGRYLPDTVLAQMARLVDLLRGVLDAGRASGRFRPLDPLLTHMMIMGLFNFYVASAPLRARMAAACHPDFAAGDPASLDRAVDHITDVVLTALTHPDARTD